jgi:hypothetical protein
MPVLPFRLPTKSGFLRTGIQRYTTSSPSSPSPCCPICLIAFTNTPHTLRLRRCGHAVCTLCLILWLDYFNTCPICDKRPYKGEVGSWSFVEELRGLFVEDEDIEEVGEGSCDKIDFWRNRIEHIETVNQEKGDCVICLEVLGTGPEGALIRSCTHTFHRVCSSRWLEDHNTCSICRGVLFRMKKERMKSMWEELDENAYFCSAVGDVRASSWRSGLLQKLVAERMRVMGEPGETYGSTEVIGATDSAGLSLVL